VPLGNELPAVPVPAPSVLLGNEPGADETVATPLLEGAGHQGGRVGRFVGFEKGKLGSGQGLKEC
jgi:hypothetical protein